MAIKDLSDVWNLNVRKLGLESSIRELQHRRNKIVSISGKKYDMDGYSGSIGNLINQCEDALSSGIKGVGAVKTVNSNLDGLKEKLPLSSQTEVSDAGTLMSDEIRRLDNQIADLRNKVSDCEAKIERAKKQII